MSSLLFRSLNHVVVMSGATHNPADPVERLIGVFGLRVTLAFSAYLAVMAMR